jgi:hypothetical protein
MNIHKKCHHQYKYTSLTQFFLTISMIKKEIQTTIDIAEAITI